MNQRPASAGLFSAIDKGGISWYPRCSKQKGSAGMAVRLNDDKEMVQMIKDGLKRTGGYCPCRLERTEENKCICKEFREQIADPEFKGFCHCMLYIKD